jgi:hypothetical protein
MHFVLQFVAQLLSMISLIGRNFDCGLIEILRGSKHDFTSGELCPFAPKELHVLCMSGSFPLKR